MEGGLPLPSFLVSPWAKLHVARLITLFLIISSLNGMEYPWPFWLKVSNETIPDIEVPGETARGRALSVAATQALSGP